MKLCAMAQGEMETSMNVRSGVCDVPQPSNFSYRLPSGYLPQGVGSLSQMCKLPMLGRRLAGIQGGNLHPTAHFPARHINPTVLSLPVGDDIPAMLDTGAETSISSESLTEIMAVRSCPRNLIRPSSDRFSVCQRYFVGIPSNFCCSSSIFTAHNDEAGGVSKSGWVSQKTQ